MKKVLIKKNYTLVRHMRSSIQAALILILISCSKNSEVVTPDIISYTVRTNDSLVVTLKIKQSIKINDELLIGFEDVVADSRCPIYAICVWAGDGEIKLSISKNNYTIFSFLHTFLEPKLIEFENYKIELKTLSPYPKIDEEIKKEDYTAELVIRRK